MAKGRKAKIKPEMAKEKEITKITGVPVVEPTEAPQPKAAIVTKELNTNPLRIVKAEVLINNLLNYSYACNKGEVHPFPIHVAEYLQSEGAVKIVK